MKLELSETSKLSTITFLPDEARTERNVEVIYHSCLTNQTFGYQSNGQYGKHGRHLSSQNNYSQRHLAIGVTVKTDLGRSRQQAIHWLCAAHRHSTKAEKEAQLNCVSKDFHRRYPTKDRVRLCSVVWRTNWEDCKAAGLLPKPSYPSSAPEKEVWISNPDTIFQDETSNGATVLAFSCARSYVRIKSI